VLRVFYGWIDQLKYPASKHYSDLSVHEPIPEIELRYNEPMRAGYESFARHAWWAIAAIIVSQLCLAIFLKKTITGTILSMVFGFGILFVIVAIVYKAQRKAGENDPGDPWGVSIRDQIRYWFFYAIVMWSLMVGFQVFSDGIIEGIFSSAWYTLMFGIALAACARFARQPGQISCMKCDYPLVGLKLPCPCPECGTTISYLSDATDRPRARDTRLVFVGIAIAVLSLTLMVLRFYRPQAIYTAMPRAALLQLAPNDRGAFDTLMRTAMTREEENQLIAGMYSARTGFQSGSSYEQSEWFGAMIVQGRLRSDQLDDLYAEFTTLEIDAPTRARVGEPVRLTLRAEYTRVAQPTWYFFAGFSIDDDPRPLARASQVMSRTFLVNGPDEENIARGYVPVLTWTPMEPGIHTVHARVVFALGSGATLGNPISWDANDRPKYPTPPVWERVVEIEHTIEVVD